MDRLAGMELFVKVAELGGYSVAARALGVSKSAVSKHVTALEERLGVRLLNRTTRRLALTEAGEAFREACVRIMADLDAAETTAGRHGSEPRGKLKISAPMTFGFAVIAPAVPVFLARFPGLEIELSLNDRIVDLIEDGLDMAVRVGSLRDSTLIARRLGTAESYCAASPAYLRAAGTPTEPGGLIGHNCLLYTYRRTPELWTFQRGEQRREVRVRGSFSSNNGDALRAAARGGLGIVHLPDFVMGDDVQDGTLTQVLPGWRLPSIPIHAVFPPHRLPSAKLRVLIDFLIEWLGRTCRKPPVDAARVETDRRNGVAPADRLAI